MTPRTFNPTGRLLTVLGLTPDQGRKSELVAQMAAAWEKAGGIVQHKTLGDMVTGKSASFIIIDDPVDFPADTTIWDSFGWGPPQDPNSWGTADFSTIEARMLSYMLADVTEPFINRTISELKDPPPLNKQAAFYALALGMAGIDSLFTESVPGGSELKRAMLEAEERAPRMATDDGQRPIPHWQKLNGAGKPWKAKKRK